MLRRPPALPVHTCLGSFLPADFGLCVTEESLCVSDAQPKILQPCGHHLDRAWAASSSSADDGTWWIVETVTDPKCGSAASSRANPRRSRRSCGRPRSPRADQPREGRRDGAGAGAPRPPRSGHHPSSPSSGDDSFKSKSHSFKRKNGHDSHAKEGTSHASGDAQVDEALLRVGALEVENWAHEDCLHPEYLPRNKLRSESAAIRKAMEALRKKSSHHRIRILAFIQMFVATLILTAIWAVRTNGGKT